MISNPLAANPGLRGGANVMLTVNGLGIMASAKTSGGSFAGYFRVALNPKYCTVSKGTVESVPVGKDGPVEPQIIPANSTTGIPISGTGTKSAPQLALDSALADPVTGLSYVCLVVTPVSAKQAAAGPQTGSGVLTAGTLDATTPVLVQHLGALTPKAGSYLEVIAAIQWRNGSAWKVIQHVYFNLKFVLVTPAAGQGAPYGFFPPS